DHYWFKEAFGEADRDIIRDQLRHVSHEVGVPIGQLRVLDVGTGGEGRIVKILLDIVEELDPDNLDNFKKRIRGFDLVPKVVKNAKSALGSLGIPERNIFEGDFLDLPDKFKREKFHLVTAMMHTPWHCVTEEEWTKFMQNMEQTMAPGGRLLFDTVHIIDPHDTPDREKTFADFHSFYTILWRRYCDKMQPVVNQVVGPYMNEGHEVPLLRKLSRHFVQDHTAGIEDASFVREIPTQAFLERICEDNDINLRMAVSTTVYNQNSGDAELMEALGKRWIRQNNLERYVFYKIAERLHRLTGQLPTFDQINEIFKDIRYQMTRKYANEYRSFKKDKTA
ncbi:class I SAM-dependent methyltransferase, partial [Patescibacteria group bacterium]|nr:class I SAM-dependent methyltransferase [Patescibacteria group bacterium]